MIKVLITGANGQLGRSIERTATGHPGFDIEYTDIEQLDITDRKQVEKFLEQKNFSYLVNCAAYTNVDGAENDSRNAYLLNAGAVRNLAQSSAKHGIFMIHISTDYVFNGKQYRPYRENDPASPESVYGKSKRKGERLFLREKTGIIIRTSWLLSEFGKNFLKTILKSGREKKELRVIFDQIGSPTYSGHMAEAILDIITILENEPERKVPGIYHYSGEGVCSWYDLAIEILEISGIDCKVTAIETKDFPKPAKRPHYSVLNKNRIKENFRITIPHWKEGIRDCIANFLSDQ